MARGKKRRGKGGKKKAAPKVQEEKKSAAEEALAAADQKVGDAEKLAGASDKVREMVEATVCSHAQPRGGAASEHARDIHIEELTLMFHGARLLEDTTLNLNYGQRYCLLGPNGCGKSTLLRSIGYRLMEFPEQIDVFLVDGEIEASDKTALEAVLDADQERQKLEEQAESLTDLLTDEDTSDDLQDIINQRLEDIYDRLDGLDASTAESRAAGILTGLQFTPEMQAKRTREFSGGWRMRIALARALFLKPTCLLLDEPTNHLDMHAVIWLEHYLSKWNQILLMVSHSQDFMNNVCTNTIQFDSVEKRLVYYGGNYDTYVRTRKELETEQMKRYNWEQEQIANMKEYIARFGHGSAKLAKQAQSKEKTLAKMIEKGLTKKVVTERHVSFRFVNTGKLPPPVLQFVDVSFGYPNCPHLYDNVEFGVDCDSRIALVGPNGAGKSTLLNLMQGKLMPTNGMVRPHSHLKLGRYSQHNAEELPLEKSALQFFLDEYADWLQKEHRNKQHDQIMRQWIGRFGITGVNQTCPMKNLSDGLLCRVAFANLAQQKPHILLLDEPTNHLDIETIDALADAINAFDGGMVLVSHDLRLIDQVANEVWNVENGGVNVFRGDIAAYKDKLREIMSLPRHEVQAQLHGGEQKSH